MGNISTDEFKAELNDAMMDYGFDIIRTLVTDIDPDPQVKIAMNRINAADREKTAAQYEGDAQRILIVVADLCVRLGWIFIAIVS